MKIALQEGLLPGASLAEKLDFAESLAIEGLEVSGGSRLYDHVEQYEQALAGRSIKIASICGQETFDWLDPDPRKRANSLAETRRQLAACGHFQAVRPDRPSHLWAAAHPRPFAAPRRHFPREGPARRAGQRPRCLGG